jgi:hypothetical protein
MGRSDWISAAAFALSVISILWQVVRERNARHLNLLERKNEAYQICQQAIRSLMDQRRELAAIANLELRDMPRAFQPMLKANFESTVQTLRDAETIEVGLRDFDRKRHTAHAKRVRVERMYSIATTLRDQAEATKKDVDKLWKLAHAIHSARVRSARAVS